MRDTRREFITKATAGMAVGIAAAQLSEQAAVAQEPPKKIRVGAREGVLGKGGLEAAARAAECGADGVETRLDGLRDPKYVQQLLDEGKKHNILYPSISLDMLNSVPLCSDPRAGVYLADAIDAAPKIGAKCLLTAFFGKGAINMNNADDLRRLVDVLKMLAPRAEANGVIIGLENTLSAEDNLKILEMVKHPFVQVYYDFKNSAGAGRDVCAEIRQIGKERLCQVHLKNGGDYLEKITNVNWPECAKALKDIGYDGWYVLETSAPSKDNVADAKKNIEYVRQVFG